MIPPRIFFPILIAVVSVIAFMLYAIDKAKSKRKGKARHIPEIVLLLTSVFGGAIGASIAMVLLRHKTKHWYFVVVNALFLILQIGFIVYLLSHPILK